MCGGKGVCLGVGWGVHGVICSTVLAYMGPIIGGSCCKYHFCGDKSFVVANNEHMFVVTKHVFCHDRRCVLSQQTHVCYDKHEFVTTKVLLRQRWYLWRLPLISTNVWGERCVWGGGGGEGCMGWSVQQCWHIYGDQVWCTIYSDSMGRICPTLDQQCCHTSYIMHGNCQWKYKFLHH